MQTKHAYFDGLRSDNLREKARDILRGLLVVIAAAVTSPLWLCTWLESSLSRKDGLFKSCSEFLSLFPGKPGIFLRRGFYSMCLRSFAADGHIGFGTILAHPQVSIGRGVYIGDRCTVGKADIEDAVTIGSNVDILSGRRQHHFDRMDVPIQDQGGLFEQVHIGQNTWIGNSSVIMADVGHDCIIGAGSVVVRPIPPRSVAVGNPATVKKVRIDDGEKNQEPRTKNQEPRTKNQRSEFVLR